MTPLQVFPVLLVISAFTSTSATPNATWSSCCGPLDVACATWATISFSPAAPVAGAQLTIAGLGVGGVSAVLNQPLATGLRVSQKQPHPASKTTGH